VKANVWPSELYTLSLPGTTRFRLRSDDSGFDNLFLAGDWTLTDLNVGCFEAAVISGMMASRAICSEPRHIYMRLPELGEPERESPIVTGVRDLLKLVNPETPSYWWDWQNPGFAEKVYRTSRSGFRLRPEIEGVNLTTFLVGFVNTSFARNVLPSGLELLTPSWTPPGMHPVLYGFGYQQQVTVSGLRWKGVNYLETVVGISNVRYVRKGHSEGPYFYITTIWLDHPVAAAAGWIRGFPKRLARINASMGSDATQARYEIVDPLNSTKIASATFRAKDRHYSLGSFDAAEEIKSYLKQPWITSVGLGYVVTSFSLNFEDAIAQPVEAHLDVAANSLPGLPFGHYSWEGLGTGKASRSRVAPTPPQYRHWSRPQAPQRGVPAAALVPGVAFRVLFHWTANAGTAGSSFLPHFGERTRR